MEYSVQKGIALLQKGKESEAIAYFDQLIRVSPDEAQAYFYRGFAKSVQAEYKKAIDDYTKALSLNPRPIPRSWYSNLYLNRAQAYENLGEHDLAKKDWTQYGKWHPLDFLQGAFPNEGQAIANGERILLLLRSSTPDVNEKAKSLVGAKVAFCGGAAPPGGNADLVVDKDTVVEVEIVPPGDPRPPAVYWEAGVLGTLHSIDVEKKVIRVTASKENWRLGATW